MLSQFRQNKNQYCSVSCVCNFARSLGYIYFPLLYQKKYPVLHGLKEQQNLLMCYGKSFKNATKRRNFDSVQ